MPKKRGKHFLEFQETPFALYSFVCKGGREHLADLSDVFIETVLENILTFPPFNYEQIYYYKKYYTNSIKYTMYICI